MHKQPQYVGLFFLLQLQPTHQSLNGNREPKVPTAVFCLFKSYKHSHIKQHKEVIHGVANFNVVPQSGLKQVGEL